MASRFAHLVGLGRTPVAARAAEDEDERKEREDKEQAERDEDCRRMEDDGKDTGESEDEKEARHAREDSRGKKASAEEDDDEEGDDDSDKEEMRGTGTIARARSRERGRIAAIVSSPAAASNPVLALELACSGSMSRDEAVRVLSRTPAPARQQRSDKNPRIGAGGSAAQPGSQGDAQAMWDKAFARVVPGYSQARR